jgi:hypothetical protein
MKLFKKSVFACMVVLSAIGFTACEEANEYEDAYTDNPSWVEDYTDSLEIAHPDSLTNTTWVRGSGIKFNAYGEEIQGYVESLEFVTKDSVVVKMSEGVTEGTMGADDSNTRENPYEYTYTNVTGALTILKVSINDKGAHTKTAIFTGVAVSNTKWGDMLTVAHFGDTPVQTYLVRK